MPEEISNLPIETSIRWAKDQEQLDKELLQGKSISTRAQIDVTLPSYASEFDTLFEMQKKNIPYADFSPPPEYTTQRKRTFTHQVIPSLGTDEKIEAQRAKIDAIRPATEQPREAQEQEKEKKVLTTLLDIVTKKDKLLIAINSLRNQYQKG